MVECAAARLLLIKQIIQLEVDLVYDKRKVFDVLHEIKVVHIDDQDPSKIVISDPVLVMLVKIFEIV